MNDLDTLLAYERIRQLASRYAIATDRRDIEGLVALFVDDVRVGRNTYGRDALRASFVEQLGSIGVSFLNVGTHQIDLVDADSATGHVYCKAEIDTLDGRWVHQAIRYDDTYERRMGEWLFVRRKHLLFYGAPTTPHPQQLAPANWPENPAGLGTLPFSDPTWQEFNHTGRH